MQHSIIYVYAVILLLWMTQAQASGPLYRCEQQGQVVMTDRPVDQANCQPISTSPTSRADAIAVPSASRATTVVRTKHRSDESIASEQIKAKQQCDRIRFRLDEIARKQRDGYSLKQGEQLNERKRVLSEQLRVDGCR